jgi:hypothetical protein
MRYPAAMNEPKTPHCLIPAARVKELLTRSDPDYGKAFTEEEWSAVTERIDALARLIWRISCRRAKEGQESQTVEPVSANQAPRAQTVSLGGLGRK